MDAPLLEKMVGRFLSWKLPEGFNPDGGIKFDPVGNSGTAHHYRHEPTGTNLLDAGQAKAMIQHLTEGLVVTEPVASKPTPIRDEVLERLRPEIRVEVQRALLATLGDTYDCTRVWMAWSVGTMGEDDFEPVLDRLDSLVDEISEPVLALLASHDSGSGQGGESASDTLREALEEILQPIGDQPWRIDKDGSAFVPIFKSDWVKLIQAVAALHKGGDRA